jgi:hypothetical protein
MVSLEHRRVKQTYLGQLSILFNFDCCSPILRHTLRDCEHLFLQRVRGGVFESQRDPLHDGLQQIIPENQCNVLRNDEVMKYSGVMIEKLE